MNYLMILFMTCMRERENARARARKSESEARAESLPYSICQFVAEFAHELAHESEARACVSHVRVASIHACARPRTHACTHACTLARPRHGSTHTHTHTHTHTQIGNLHHCAIRSISNSDEKSLHTHPLHTSYT
jgi:hypothetical protein